MLVEISEEIVVQLTIIFKESLDTGSVPDDWRNANVCPTFKKGKRNSPENYRPVSLTSQICKLLELIIRDELVTYMELHHLIYNSQHGFRKGRSCLTNLLTFLDSVSSSIDSGNCIDTIYLDFAKAFDKVPHQSLLYKLQSRGITGSLLQWIAAWLIGRKQRVHIARAESQWTDVTSGVPKGQCLGHCCFSYSSTTWEQTSIN